MSFLFTTTQCSGIIVTGGITISRACLILGTDTRRKCFKRWQH